MKAIMCKTNGDPNLLEVVEMPPPADPGDAEVTVELKSRGVSFVDVLMVAGQYQMKPDLPFIPGQEAAGVIVAAGKGVTDLQVGDRVMTSHSTGGFVELAVLNQSRVRKIPDNMTFDGAAAFQSNYATAFYALQRGTLKAGETLLVHGAAGGVGLAAVQIGKLMGATVIAAASADNKLQIVKELGADHTINYSDGFREKVKALTGQKGADVIYDPVGGDVFDESMRCINRLGRILVIGFTSGRAALAKTNHLLIKDASVIGLTMGSFSRHEPEAAESNFKALMQFVEAGKLVPYISHRLPLVEAAKAMKIIKDREVVGKVVLY
jgi:NADPH2:quinone reductase